MDRNGPFLPQWFQRWGIGAWLVVGMFLVILGSIWLLALTSSIGITSAPDAAQHIKDAVPQIGRTLLHGVAGGIAGLTSIVVFLGFTAFTSFFLLMDGPRMGRWIQRHMGMRPAEALRR